MKNAWQTALDYLARRSLTRYELSKKLEDKGFSRSEIIEALAKLDEWGYLNDGDVALSYCQARARKFSRARVRQDLHRRGISPSLIEDVLNNTYPVEREVESCLVLAQKYWVEETNKWEKHFRFKKNYNGVPRQTFLQNKVAQRLSQKGYGWETIRYVLSVLTGEE